MKWKAKPYEPKSLGVHALIGFLGTLLGLILGGYSGALNAWLIVIVGGYAWEALMTPILAKRFNWDHPHGDGKDWLAFIAGGFLVVAFTLTGCSAGPTEPTIGIVPQIVTDVPGVDAVSIRYGDGRLEMKPAPVIIVPNPDESGKMVEKEKKKKK